MQILPKMYKENQVWMQLCVCFLLKTEIYETSVKSAIRLLGTLQYQFID